MLLITGPGRSGTSVLALFCQAMGYDPGGAWHDSVDAGLEHERMVQIDDALLRELRQTGSLDRALEAHREEMRKLNLPVVKDPRITINSALLRAWHSVHPDLKVLLSYRKPEHALASRERSAKSLNLRERSHPDDFRRGFADTIETLLELEIPFEILLFPHFLDRFDQVYTAFQNLGLTMDRDKAERVWNQVVDRDKVHIKLSSTGTKEEAEAASTHGKSRWNPFGRGGK